MGNSCANDYSALRGKEARLKAASRLTSRPRRPAHHMPIPALTPRELLCRALLHRTLWRRRPQHFTQTKSTSGLLQISTEYHYCGKSKQLESTLAFKVEVRADGVVGELWYRQNKAVRSC